MTLPLAQSAVRTRSDRGVVAGPVDGREALAPGWVAQRPAQAAESSADLAGVSRSAGRAGRHGRRRSLPQQQGLASPTHRPRLTFKMSARSQLPSAEKNWVRLV